MICGKCHKTKTENDFYRKDKLYKTCNKCYGWFDPTFNVIGIAGCFSMVEIKKALKSLKIDLIDHNMVDLTKENYVKFINDYNTQKLDMDIDTQTFVSEYKQP